jgi:allophanate hydrolase
MKLPLLFAENAAKRGQGMDIKAIARAALKAASAAPDCFVSLCAAADVDRQAEQVDANLAAGAKLPLAGLTFCVKDNIDVAAMASTGNCPGFGRVADTSAPAVQRVLDAGAILIGKNTMDQFATGLNGTRSPSPICQNAVDPAIIPGGSSSGSAVAVAKGICDFAFGSDTGGSGRVPAAANGIVGLKPTPGLVSGRGMVYCNRSFDVIPIFAKTVQDARRVFEVIEGPDPSDPFAYTGAVAKAQNHSTLRLAVPDRLDHFGDAAAKAAHQVNLDLLKETGATLVEIDFAPFAEAGQLVFGSALVAERLIDYGRFIAQNPDAVLPPVAQAINAGRAYSAQDLFEVLHRLAQLKLDCKAALGGADALVLPTIPRLFTVSEMLADPMSLNTIMGTYTYFANPLGFAAIAVPGRMRRDGLPSSVCFASHAGCDHILTDIAQRFETSVTQRT